MKKNNKKKDRKIREKRNLSIVNYGDVIIIKNRTAVASAVLGTIILAFSGAVMFTLKDAWNNPVFWGVFAFVVLGTVYMLASAVLNKIVLNSPNMTMTVCFPFKKEYKFSDINYIDMRSSKPKDGIVTHKVSAYIGNGRMSVDVVTTSASQAEEIAALLRGMLDNGAMEYPECDDEPKPDNEEEKKPVFPLFAKKKKSSENDDEIKFTPIEKKTDEEKQDTEEKVQGDTEPTEEIPESDSSEDKES